MKEPTNYIAFTIGPIYKTLTQLRKTRAIFAGSYLFSYIMKFMMQRIIGLGINQSNILLPVPDNLTESAPGAGLFPDRLIFINPIEGDFKKFIDARNKLIKHLAEAINKDIGFPTEKLIDHLGQYLKIYLIEVSLKKGEQTINQINQYLNTVELKDQFPITDKDYLIKFLNKTGGTFLIRDAFGTRKNRFESLIEISTVELKQNKNEEYDKIIKEHIFNKPDKLYDLEEENDEQDDDEMSIIKELKAEFKDNFRAYHKYVAIVNADGDRIGKYIENLNADEEALKRFSRKLLEFGIKARDTIRKYGGSPVYIGGDDLLFFAPVVSLVDNKPVSVFKMIQEIDDEFYKLFPQAKDKKTPSLSYGVSISYYKYPLNEALKKSYDLLHEAKNEKKCPEKNSINFKLLKHSGSFIEGIIQKGDKKLFENFQNFIEKNKDLNDTDFLSSIVHTLSNFEITLSAIAVDNTKLQNWFNNNFDEEEHKKNRKFINKSIIPFIHSAYTCYSDKKEAFKLTISTLKFTKFLRSKDDEHE